MARLYLSCCWCGQADQYQVKLGYRVSVSGGAPRTSTSHTSLVLQKTAREPTFTVRATADQHVEWRLGGLSVLWVLPFLALSNIIVNINSVQAPSEYGQASSLDVVRFSR